MVNIRKLENELWEAADLLRADSKVTSQEYCMPVLGLIFLRYAYSRFKYVEADILKDRPVRNGRVLPVEADDFKTKSAIYLPEEARYDYLLNLPDNAKLGEAINNAMELIEEQSDQLKGILPKNYTILKDELLRELLRIFNNSAFNDIQDDIIGRIYEYFLNKFAPAVASDDGVFFTPKSLVRMIVNIIEPNHGTVLDPACGSGGMFVSSADFIEKFGVNANTAMTFYGQEKVEYNAKLCAMNMAVHGLNAKIVSGDEANSFYHDAHNLNGCCDFVMANPPFNVDKVKSETAQNAGRLPFGLPSVNKNKEVGNANYLWISYFYSYLNETGRAGFVMASSATDTLMQTIARANRVCDGKSNGLIVDYIGVVKALREALADYTKNKNNDTPNNPAPDKEELIKKVLDTINSIDKYMAEHGFSLKSLVEATDFEKLALVAAGANAMCISTEVKRRFEIQARELFRCFKYIERKEVSAETVHYKNAISAVYEQLQEKRKHADNSALMAQLNEIVSSYVNVTKNPGDEDSRKFDISNIDFDRLRKEFEKANNRNLMFKDLQDVVEERLARMLSNNPLRINYYERYQEIIDQYNNENKKDEIAITFENLMNLVKDLDEEQKRYVREGFDSDEELTMFDLLVKDSLSKEEIKKVKKLAQTMLARIKAKIHELDHWRDKEKTQSIVRVTIRDLLWEKLPESYDDVAISVYQNKIFEYVYNTYPAA